MLILHQWQGPLSGVCPATPEFLAEGLACAKAPRGRRAALDSPPGAGDSEKGSGAVQDPVLLREAPGNHRFRQERPRCVPWFSL